MTVTGPYLSHLVTFALPAQAFVIQRVTVCADVDGFPVHEVACPLAYVKHMQSSRFWCGHPLLRLGDVVTPWTQFLVEWNCCAFIEHGHLSQNRVSSVQFSKCSSGSKYKGL